MALIVRGLSKRFGRQRALDSIDLTLGEGVVALLGANGSGKSTLLRILATLMPPDSGNLSFHGWSYREHLQQLRAQIGYLSQEFELPETLTPRQLLQHLANLRGGSVPDALTKLRLAPIADRHIAELSSGELRRVGIAQTLLGSPNLLLLDELTRGLDAVEREYVFALLGKRGKLTIFSTHTPKEVENLAQQVIVLQRGCILFSGSPEALINHATGKVYELCIPEEKLADVAGSMVVSRIVRRETETVVRVIGEPTDYSARMVAPSFEDAYLWLVGKR